MCFRWLIHNHQLGAALGNANKPASLRELEDRLWNAVLRVAAGMDAEIEIEELSIYWESSEARALRKDDGEILCQWFRCASVISFSALSP